MRVKVNGKETDLPASCTVMEALLRSGVRPEAVAVEHNLNVLARNELAEIRLAEGDTLEIVKFVGGGCS